MAQAPVDLEVCEGKGYTLTSTADATGTSPVTYQWYENDVAVPGANASSLTVATGRAEAGNYVYVRKASNAACIEVPSNTFTVRVKPTPTISRSGGDASQCVIQYTTPFTTIIYTASDDATITMTGSLPQGVTSAASGASFTISGTPTETGTFGYSLTAAVSGCTSTAAAGTIWVHSWVTPPADAVTTQLWCIGPQLWSDRIVAHPSNCGETECFSTSQNQTQYRVSDDRVYYSFRCASNNADLLCPPPWHIPARSESTTLFGYATPYYLSNEWGYGGIAGACNISYADERAYYWTTSNWEYNVYSYAIWYATNAGHNISPTYNGLQVRCVK
jgi:hypothetical protein